MAKPETLTPEALDRLVVLRQQLDSPVGKLQGWERLDAYNALKTALMQNRATLLAMARRTAEAEASAVREGQKHVACDALSKSLTDDAGCRIRALEAEVTEWQAHFKRDMRDHTKKLEQRRQFPI